MFACSGTLSAVFGYLDLNGTVRFLYYSVQYMIAKFLNLGLEPERRNGLKMRL